jgi:hypothetical protein
MPQLARNILGLIGAVLLMVILGFAAFVLARSNPGVHGALFYGAAGILYTMAILFVLNR